MTNNFSDVETAQNVQQLCDIINKAIAKAELALAKAQNISEVKLLIQEINEASQILENHQKTIETIGSSIDQRLLDAQEIQNSLEGLKELPSQLSQFGLDQNILIEIKHYLNELQKAEKNIEQIKILSENSLQKNSKDGLLEIKTLSDKIRKEFNTYTSDLEKKAVSINAICVSFQEKFDESELKIRDLSDSSENKMRVISGDFENVLKEMLKTHTSDLEKKSVSINAICLSFQEKLDKSELKIRNLSDSSENKMRVILGDFDNLLKEIQKSSKKIDQDKENLRSIIDTERKKIESSIGQYNKQIENVKIDFRQEIEKEKQNIRTMLEQHDQTVKSSKETLSELNLALSNIGGMEGIDNMLSQMKIANAKLKESRQEIVTVQSLENYLQDFKKHRNHKQFRNWLQKELGFVGMIVYVLSLFLPKRD